MSIKKTMRLSLGKTTIHTYGDCDADTSWMGEYSDSAKPGSIIRQTGEFIEDLPEDEPYPEKGREYRFFHPYAAGEKIGSDDYRQYAKRDFDRMESLNRGQWCFIGIEVATEVLTDIGISDIIRESLWGIESDSDQEYLDAEILNLKTEIRHRLQKLGFSKKEIDASLNNAEEIED